MAKLTLLNFAEHCEKDKFYRLDFIREVSFEDSYDPSMPFKTLIVNFSEYSEKYQSLDQIKQISRHNTFKSYLVKEEALSIKVDVTNQYFLKPGTVWKNGAPIWEPLEFFNVAISGSEDTIVELGVERGRDYRLPEIEYADGLQLLKYSNCIVDGSNVTVYIPTTEVIRYYFSGSTYFTEQLFNGALKLFWKNGKANKLFYEHDVDREEKSVYLWLKRNCYDSDAYLIARAIYDPAAMKAMSYVYASLITAKRGDTDEITGEPIKSFCPKTKLPFLDGSEMEVLGQWLRPNSNKVFDKFIVWSIGRCNHSMPYEKIKIESVDSYSSKGIDSDKTPVPNRARNPDAEDVNSPDYTQDEKPRKDIEPMELEFYEQRFSHLEGISIEKVKNVSDEEKAARYDKEPDEKISDDASSLPGGYGKDNNAQSWQNRINDAESIDVSERIERVSEALADIFGNKDDWSCEALPVGIDDTTKPFKLCEFGRPRGKSGNYCWNSIGDRNRKALFLQITDGLGRFVYALEIEGKDNIGYSLYLFCRTDKGNIHNINSITPQELLYQIANNSGNRITTDILKGFETVSIKHVTTDNDSFSERIERAIKGLFR